MMQYAYKNIKKKGKTQCLQGEKLTVFLFLFVWYN